MLILSEKDEDVILSLSLSFHLKKAKMSYRVILIMIF